MLPITTVAFMVGARVLPSRYQCGSGTTCVPIHQFC